MEPVWCSAGLTGRGGPCWDRHVSSSTLVGEHMPRYASAVASLLALLVAGLVSSGATAAVNAPFQFDLLELEVAATAPGASFFDDFSDGVRSQYPTIFITDPAPGVTTEYVGRLEFTDADGALELFDLQAQFQIGYADQVYLLPSQPHVYIDGGGSLVLTATWGPEVPTDDGVLYRSLATAIALQDPLFQSEAIPHVYVELVSSSLGAPSALPPACDGPGPVVLAVFSDGELGGTPQTLACDLLDPADVTGPIAMRVSFDDGTDEFDFAYSVDGGTTFVAASTWDAPTGPVAVPEAQGQILIPLLQASAAAAPAVPVGGGLAVALSMGVVGWRAIARRGRGRAA